MSMHITKRRSRGRKRFRRIAAPQTLNNFTIQSAVSQGLMAQRYHQNSHRTIPGPPSIRRLPSGFITAVNEAWIRPSRLSDRVRRVLSVLDEFDQPESVLPTKARRLLERFENQRWQGAQ